MKCYSVSLIRNERGRRGKKGREGEERRVERGGERKYLKPILLKWKKTVQKGYRNA